MDVSEQQLQQISTKLDELTLAEGEENGLDRMDVAGPATPLSKHPKRSVTELLTTPSPGPKVSSQLPPNQKLTHKKKKRRTVDMHLTK